MGVNQADASDRVVVGPHFDLRRTLAGLGLGGRDPAVRFAPDAVSWATRTPHGAGTARYRPAGDRAGSVVVDAWGPGAAWLVEHAGELLGCHDDRDGFDELAARHPLVADLNRRTPGLRIGRSRAVTEAVLRAVCAQKVTGIEAKRAWQGIVLRWGEPAPGPVRLWVPPAAATLATVAYEQLHTVGLERRRAETLKRVAGHAGRIEQTVDMTPADAAARLQAVPGVGAWTAAEAAAIALGDRDAVSVGDYHLPHTICLALAGEARGTDQRMLELLEPFAGHRGRVIRLIEGSGRRAARRGPRMVPTSWGWDGGRPGRPTPSARRAPARRRT